jgi:hypothetical protein
VLAGLAVVLAGCTSSSHRTVTATTTAPTSVPPATSGGTCGGPSGTGSNTGPETNVPGDIPDNQAFVTYRPASGGYSINVPEGWARSEQPTSVTFTDKFNSIRVDRQPAPAAPTAASAQNEMQAVAARLTCYQPGNVSTVSRKAGQGLLVKYRADSPPDPVTAKVVHQDVERYEFWRSGTEVVVTLSSSQGSDNVDPWRKVTDSFSWTA